MPDGMTLIDDLNKENFRTSFFINASGNKRVFLYNGYQSRNKIDNDKIFGGDASERKGFLRRKSIIEFIFVIISKAREDIIDIVKRYIIDVQGASARADTELPLQQINDLTDQYIRDVCELCAPRITKSGPRLLSSSPGWTEKIRKSIAVGVEVPAPPLPDIAPALYSVDKEPRDTPVSFFKRVYAPWLEGSTMVRADLRRLDRDLYDKLGVYLSRHKDEAAALSVPKRYQKAAEAVDEFTTRAVAAGLVPDDPGEQVKIFSRAAANLRYRLAQGKV